MTLRAVDFAYVSGLVHRASAISLQPGKEYLVEARLLPVARDTGLESVPELVEELRRREPHGSALHRRVVDAMTTNETSWFRDRTPFEALGSDVVDGLVQRRRAEGRLRVWSAGCSSGQEPYSISMTVGRRLAEAGLRLELLATDLSEEMLDRARVGSYSEFEMRRGMPDHLRSRYFTEVGRAWQISEDLRRSVSFGNLNLATFFPAMEPMDVVFLRNVLIYFDCDTKARVLDQVGRLLRPDGFLFLGAAETTLSIDSRYERVTVGGTTVYQFRGKAAA